MFHKENNSFILREISVVLSILINEEIKLFVIAFIKIFVVFVYDSILWRYNLYFSIVYGIIYIKLFFIVLVEKYAKLLPFAQRNGGYSKLYKAGYPFFISKLKFRVPFAILFPSETDVIRPNNAYFSYIKFNILL